MDRIDIHVNVGQIKLEKLLDKRDDKLSPKLKQKVIKTRQIQYSRQGSALNGDLNNKNIKKHSNLDKRAKDLLDKAANSLELSPRSYMKVIKIARTIADLEDNYLIDSKHIAEALQYRPKNIQNIVWPLFAYLLYWAPEKGEGLLASILALTKQFVRAH